jgi:nucleoside triphosphate diphosphatase
MSDTQKTASKAAQFQTLLEIMAKLRDPQTGCAWDREQTFSTIAPYTIEEAYEVAEAVARGDLAELRDELGDLLFQVVFHAQMASEIDEFSICDVIEAINTKMISRHPHVFGDAHFRTAEDQTLAWEEQKATERAVRSKPGAKISALDGVAHALPALKRAQKLQSRAARVGFDWPNVDGAFDKITEETEEIKSALAEKAHPEKISEEIGDLLFSVVNVARHLGIDAESALVAASRKFENRFKKVEALATSDLSALGLDELDNLWQQAKNSE